MMSSRLRVFGVDCLVVDRKSLQVHDTVELIALLPELILPELHKKEPSIRADQPDANASYPEG